MKKVKLIIAAVSMLSLVSSSAVYADGYAPGEGAYVGAFFGHGAGFVQAKTTTEASRTTGSIHDGVHDNLKYEGITSELSEGGLGLSGIQGGGWLGYGYKMGDLNIGFEMDYAGTDEKFKLTSTTPIELSSGQTVSEVSAEIDWIAGVGGRLGYYINDDTLLSFKGGIAASKFKVVVGSDSEEFYGGGPRFTAAVDSRIAAIDPNLSLRVEYNYTEYMTAAVHGIGNNNATNATNMQGANSEVSGAHFSGRVGLIYSFFDVNSLF